MFGKKREVVGKLGGMRKDVEWTCYPRVEDTVTIQSDKRIAKVCLPDGKAALANKGCYFVSFAQHGYTVVDVPADMLATIKELTKDDTGGPVRVA